MASLKQWLIRSYLDVGNPTSFIMRLRQRRYEYFLEALRPQPGARVLDVGSSTGYGFEMFDKGRLQVTGLDLTLPVENRNLFRSFVVGDGVALPFRDQAFDIIFCNGVIEHLASWEAQQDLAREIMRVADRFFLCTNNRYFPLEPHYLLPGFQFLPYAMQRRVVRVLPTVLPRGYWEPVRLLGGRELAQLFPGARICPERLWGLVFSWYVVKT
jgi:SAM-dependent methyltransferase